MPLSGTLRHHAHLKAHRVRRAAWPASLTFPLVLFVIITCFYSKLVFTYQFDWMWSPDIADQTLPWFNEEARQAHQGLFPLWDTHSWMGQPFPGQAQPGVAYPLNWLLWLIPLEQGHVNMMALQWYYIAIHYMAALFCYLLCRDLGRSRGASLLAGLAFSLAGYVGWTDWPQMVNGAVWAPLVFLFLLRALRGVHPWASAWLCGASVGMAWLSGHHQIPIFLTLAMGGVWLYSILKDGRVNWHVARVAGVAIAVAPIVGAMQILPAEEYGRLAWRWVGRIRVGWNDVIPYYIHGEHSFHPIHILGTLFPGFTDNSVNFMGTVIVSLGLLGIALCWREHAVKILAAVGIGALVYSLGDKSSFEGFLYAVVPFVEKARVPAMALLLFHLALATMVAFGVDGMRRAAAESPWPRRVNLCIAGFAVFLGGTIFAILLARRLSWEMDDRIVLTSLIAFLLVALVYGWRRGNLTQTQAVTLLGLLLVFELGNEASVTLADRNDSNRRQFLEKAWGNPDIAAFLQRQPGPFRVESRTDEIVGNWGDYYDVDFLTAAAGATMNAFELEMHTPQTKKLLGVKYTLARAPTDPEQHEVFRGTSGIVVYENPDVFPRAWMAHEIVPIHTGDEGRVFIRDHVNELQWKAMVMGDNPPKLSPCPGNDFWMGAKYAPSRISFRVAVECESMLVLSDTYYPGWTVKVDGRPAEIREVNLALRGVVISRGVHDIAFRYGPRSVIAGAWLTFAGLIGAAVIAVRSRKREGHHAEHR